MVSSVSDSTANTLVKAWDKTSTDIYDESIQNARDIGQIRLNYSRLSLVTTLSKNEKEDWFKFNVVSPGNFRLSAVNLSAKKEDSDDTKAVDELEAAKNEYQKAIDSFKAQGLRVEVYTYKNNRQTLVATNDESQKKQYEAFESMMRGTYKMTQKGMYYVHVTTKDGKPSEDDQLYALQLQMGDKYKHDYMTQEQSIDHTKVTEGDVALAAAEEQFNGVISGSILNAQGAASILSAGYNNLAQINKSSSKNAAARIFSLLT